MQLDFKLFDPKSLEFQPFSSFQLRFYSPTFVRQGKITYALPQADQFLFSVLEKLESYYPSCLEGLDKKSFKKWLKRALYTGEFKIKTELLMIKKNKKSGVVGFCTYYLNKEHSEPQEYLQLLYLLLHAIKFLGI